MRVISGLVDFLIMHSFNMLKKRNKSIFYELKSVKQTCFEKKKQFSIKTAIENLKVFYCYDQNKMIIIVLWQAFLDRKKKQL